MARAAVEVFRLCPHQPRSVWAERELSLTVQLRPRDQVSGTAQVLLVAVSLGVGVRQRPSVLVVLVVFTRSLTAKPQLQVVVPPLTEPLVQSVFIPQVPMVTPEPVVVAAAGRQLAAPKVAVVVAVRAPVAPVAVVAAVAGAPAGTAAQVATVSSWLSLTTKTRTGSWIG